MAAAASRAAPWKYSHAVLAGMLLSVIAFFAIHLGNGGELLNSWIKGASTVQWFEYIGAHLVAGPLLLVLIAFLRNRLVGASA